VLHPLWLETHRCAFHAQDSGKVEARFLVDAAAGSLAGFQRASRLASLVGHLFIGETVTHSSPEGVLGPVTDAKKSGRHLRREERDRRERMAFGGYLMLWVAVGSFLLLCVYFMLMQ